MPSLPTYPCTARRGSPAAATSLALLALPALLGARPAQAQQVVLSPYVALNRSMPGAPALYGATVGAHGPIFGARVGGALALRRGVVDTTARSLEAWTADADLLLDSRAIPELGAVLSAIGGFAPVAFGGVGVQGARDANGAVRAVPVWSWGGGVSRSLFGALSLETEARYRVPARLDSSSFTTTGFVRGWEYRAGFSLRFGGGPRGGGEGGRIPRIPYPTGGGTGTVGSASARAIIDTGDDYLGTRYVSGGSTPRGFDCSGFVQYVFARHDVTLPRTSRQQATAGRALPASIGALRAGDLMLFASEGSRIDHVAIYAGNNRILHSTSSGGGVRYDDLGTDRGRWFVSRMVSARRVIDGGSSLIDALQAAEFLSETVKSFDAPDRAPRPR